MEKCMCENDLEMERDQCATRHPPPENKMCAPITSTAAGLWLVFVRRLLV